MHEAMEHLLHMCAKTHMLYEDERVIACTLHITVNAANVRVDMGESHRKPALDGRDALLNNAMRCAYSFAVVGESAAVGDNACVRGYGLSDVLSEPDGNDTAHIALGAGIDEHVEVCAMPFALRSMGTAFLSTLWSFNTRVEE